MMATENILMAAVRAGGDRQQLHETIRKHSHDAVKMMKEQGGENDLAERLTSDKSFDQVDLGAAMEPSQFVGRAAEQVDEFIDRIVDPIRQKYGPQNGTEELRV